MYLPPLQINDAELPKAWHKDIAAAIRIIEEKFAMFYPAYPYYNLSRQETVAVNSETPVGVAGTTQFDPLFGESVKLADGQTTWAQPHLSADADATNTDVHTGPFNLHLQIRRDNLELDLKRLGWDKVRDLVAWVPLSMLDAQGITVRLGDYFLWDDQPFTILQYDRVGYWRNSNLRLYMIMNCESRKAGS